ncbi:threonine/serine exporter family protein [Oceanobacillus limi]|nr:threonine/serine exporter family protein [Oceanobacillus limi]
MLAGKIMLECSAETYRVEDTMDRIAIAFGVENPQSYATPTGINFSVDRAEAANFMRIAKRTTDLYKIAEVNRISRMIVSGELELNEAFDSLKELDRNHSVYSNTLLVIAATFVSGCFTIMFGGTWADFIPACIAGGLGFAAMLGSERLVEIRFIAEFFASLIIGLIAVGFITLGIGLELDKIIIGAVMPLVPGLHITNAVRDLMAGHLVAGVSKGAEAVLTAFAIGAGIASVLAFI